MDPRLNEQSPPDVELDPFDDAYEGRSAFASAHKPPMSRRFVPFVESLRTYSGGRLRIDALAGVTVAALALPSAMAFAELAGVPVTAGLYALLLPVIVYALLGSAPRSVIGPEGTVSLLVASALAPLAITGSAEYTAFAAGLAILVGAIFFAARLLRLGWIADYFSQAVLVGYITGVAIVLIVGQFGKLVGLSSDEDHTLLELADIVGRLGDANRTTVAVAVLSLLVARGSWAASAGVSPVPSSWCWSGSPCRGGSTWPVVTWPRPAMFPAVCHRCNSPTSAAPSSSPSAARRSGSSW